MYSFILDRSSAFVFDLERSSTTKSGQMGENLLSCSADTISQRAPSIQEASGDRIAPFGSVNPPEESKTSPPPFVSAHSTSLAVSLAFLRPAPLFAGDIM